MSADNASSGERNAGLLLMAAAALALVIANTRLNDAYHALLHAPLGPLTVHCWIADALMALFFLLVGLEVKREWYDGRLASSEARRLPIVAAAAGMTVPAAIYLAVTGGKPTLVNGWAIPAATDIAFALGVLALLGSRAPASIKLLLVTIAVIDDIGAVVLIALFYTADLNVPALATATLLLGLMATLNMFGERRLWPFLLLFAALWLAVFQSGIHATVAGVLAALTIPLGRGEPVSPLKKLEHRLQPLVMLGVVPLFGFASAGVHIDGLDELTGALPLGVALGLFLGKQLGVFGAVWLAHTSGLARKPQHLRWPHIYGAALLCGIGFTMSLFIGELAFADRVLVDEAKIGTLVGSLLAGLLGYSILVLTRPIHETAVERQEAADVFGEDADEDPTVCMDR